MSTNVSVGFDPHRFLAGFAAAGRYRGRRDLRLHLGPGPVRIPGWIRVSSDPNIGEFDLDLRLALPFDDASVERIYAWRIPDSLGSDLVPFALEAARVLAPGGRIRLAGRDRAPVEAEVERLALQGVMVLDRIRAMPVWSAGVVVALLGELGFAAAAEQPVDVSEAADLVGLESLHGLTADEAARWFIVEAVR